MFHRHVWKAVKVWHYRDTSFSSEGVPSTTITFLCKKCGKAKSQDLFAGGYIELEDLQ